MSAGFADLLALQGVWLGGRRRRGGGGSSSGVDETLLSAAQAARILRERIRLARDGERGRLTLLLALIEGDDDL